MELDRSWRWRRIRIRTRRRERLLLFIGSLCCCIWQGLGGGGGGSFGLGASASSWGWRPQPSSQYHASAEGNPYTHGGAAGGKGPASSSSSSAAARRPSPSPRGHPPPSSSAASAGARGGQPPPHQQHQGGGEQGQWGGGGQRGGYPTSSSSSQQQQRPSYPSPHQQQYVGTGGTGGGDYYSRPPAQQQQQQPPNRQHQYPSSSSSSGAGNRPHPPSQQQQYDYPTPAVPLVSSSIALPDRPPDGLEPFNEPTIIEEEEPWAGADWSAIDKDEFFNELEHLYQKKVFPIEQSSKYSQFHSAPLNAADFKAKPMVLLLGQYSVGKTSFIRSLLKMDFPGQRVGPEPTTDRFMAVMHGAEERLVPGHALAMQADKPFQGVSAFGNHFLTKFEAAEVPASILRNITLIDTPGILSGEKQRLGRDYDYGAVIQWFADRADLIIIMFDAHKLDISDELKHVMNALKVHQDKIRIVLNKADQIDSQQLMRIYGALMWSLGKVVDTPEVCRVYIGSFWEHPLRVTENRVLLEKEKQDLLAELASLPQNAVVRRINELVKRSRTVKVHAYLIHYLRKQIPMMMGKSEKQHKLIEQMEVQYKNCASRYNLPMGDFPNINKFRRRLRELDKDLRSFPKLDKSMVKEMERVFSHDIPKLLEKASHRSHQPAKYRSRR